MISAGCPLSISINRIRSACAQIWTTFSSKSEGGGDPTPPPPEGFTRFGPPYTRIRLNYGQLRSVMSRDRYFSGNVQLYEAIFYHITKVSWVSPQNNNSSHRQNKNYTLFRIYEICDKPADIQRMESGFCMPRPFSWGKDSHVMWTELLRPSTSGPALHGLCLDLSVFLSSYRHPPHTHKDL